MNKIVIIGCGNVGMSYAYALLNQRTKVEELVLLDIDKEKTVGEAMDLNHCLAFAPSKIKIKAGDYSDCNDATIICIAAGKNQEVGETRLDLIKKNYDVFKSIITEINKTNFNGIYLIATNPVDIMSYITMKLSGQQNNKVIGSGTILDTARLRYLIGDELDINPKNIHAYVIGEHGDSEFVPWSNALVGLKSIDNYLDSNKLETIASSVKNSAYEIINRKGATYYGIGMCLVKITNSILDNDNSIITLSAFDKEKDIYYGMPCIVNKEGIKDIIKLDLNNEEIKMLENSINILKEYRNIIDK
ncbi:MAG: L-lactate dehydrogenase [Firmicutes bacterium]|nr:L-lactate dehydrogenase [Bacillota bacterium]